MISIRKGKYAVSGLVDMITYIQHHSDIETKEMIVVEIGSYAGDATKIFAKHFKRVICIDPYQNGYDDNDGASYKFDMRIVYNQFEKEVLNKFKNVVHHKMTSEQAAPCFTNGWLDFVYIDGNHQYEYVKNDIEMWLPKIKKGGWLGGHDYMNIDFEDVTKAVDEIVGKPDMVFTDTSWIWRKQ